MMLLLILIAYFTGFSGCQQKLKKKKKHDFQFFRLRSLRPEGRGSCMSRGHAGYETRRPGCPGPGAVPGGGSDVMGRPHLGTSLLPLLFARDMRKMNERESPAYWPARQKCTQRVQQCQDRGLPGTCQQPGARAGGLSPARRACEQPASSRVCRSPRANVCSVSVW